MPLLEIRGLHKVYGQGAKAVPALRGVDLDVDRGETVALVGESGCGKTTLGRVVVGLQPATAGEVIFDGRPLEDLIGDKGFRSRVQMVFQHPDTSLNPRFRAGTTVREPRRLMKGGSRTEVDQHVDEVLTLVGLGPEYKSRFPRELSGGQQQRVAIARALIAEPELVVLDEPTSSLDQSVRGRIISLLRDIQNERDVAYLFISHDLSTVRRIADRVAVMYLGRIVEVAETETLFESPQHPYTKALLSAVPSIDPAKRTQRTILEGETPNPSEAPVGCSFQDRCPLVHDRCRVDAPTLEQFATDHDVECFAVPTMAETG
ncbi:MAG: ATP-binding cassette domain-containing protein [Acidimicrobiia bacterium]|nr:MAG: ATP-binding cassette domain-containing protein [Acidimicrobiia bacterium]